MSPEFQSNNKEINVIEYINTALSGGKIISRRLFSGSAIFCLIYLYKTEFDNLLQNAHRASSIIEVGIILGQSVEKIDNFALKINLGLLKAIFPLKPQLLKNLILTPMPVL